MSYLASPVPYNGSKKNEIKVLKDYFPNEIKTFVDVFGGGGTVSLYMSQFENFDIHYNDKHKPIADLFMTLQDEDKTKKFISDVLSIPEGKEQFLKLKKDLEFNKLIRYYYLLRTSFKAQMTLYSDQHRKTIINMVKKNTYL